MNDVERMIVDDPRPLPFVPERWCEDASVSSEMAEWQWAFERWLLTEEGQAELHRAAREYMDLPETDP